MNIIQSFWSKPLLEKFSLKHNSQTFAGWPNLEALLSSWALSCLTISKYYDKNILYTDSFGKTVFIDILNLPYFSYVKTFDKLADIDTSLWALGKMHVYGLQKEPFLHVDGDVFIWKPFDEKFLRSKLVSQSIEKNPKLYSKVLTEVQDNLNFLPKEAMEYIKRKEPNYGINTGVFGGHDIHFIKKYSKAVLKFIMQNEEVLKKIRIKNINMFFEQFLLLCFTKHYNHDVSLLFNNLSQNFEELITFHLAPFESKYIHVIGMAKSDEIINEQIILRLRMEYPEVYDKIQNSLPEINSLLIQESNR